MNLINRIPRPLFFVIGLAVLSSLVFAFAASNTVPESSAGDGSAAITGFTVSNIRYNLNVTSPQNIDSVTFSLTAVNGNPVPSSTNVQARLYTTETGYLSCTLVTSTWTCPGTGTSGVSVVLATNLEVIAADH